MSATSFSLSRDMERGTDGLPLTASRTCFEHTCLPHLKSTVRSQKYAKDRIILSRSRNSTRPSNSTTWRVSKKVPARGRNSDRRATLHKYITSLFSRSNDNVAVPKTTRSSLEASLSTSPLQGSSLSIDLISPAAFMFSSPSLRSLQWLDSEAGSRIRLLNRTRTNSFSMTDDPTIMEARLLEPLHEEGVTRTMSDVLSGISRPKGADTSTLLDRSRQISSTRISDAEIDHGTMPPGAYRDCALTTLLTLLLPHLGSADSKALRLTSRSLYQTLSVIAPPLFPAVYRVPIELLQHIYDYLGPVDFNAARHTCCGWMRASLDRSVLAAMLSRGGWSSSVLVYCARTRTSLTDGPRASIGSEEWSLSRRFARQCALASGSTLR